MPAGRHRPVLGPNPLSFQGTAAFPAVYVAHGVSSGVAARTAASPDTRSARPTLKLSSPSLRSLRHLFFLLCFFQMRKFSSSRGKALSYWTLLACTWMMRGQSGWACMWCAGVRLRCAALPQLPARALRVPDSARATQLLLASATIRFPGTVAFLARWRRPGRC